MKVEGVEVLNLNSNYEGFNPEDIFHELKNLNPTCEKYYTLNYADCLRLRRRID